MCLYVCVRALMKKALKLSTPNLVHVYCMTQTRHELTPRLKHQRSRSHAYEKRHRCTVKLEFHDAETDNDTDTDILARILADTSDTRD